MSGWDAFIGNLLTTSQAIKRAAIVGTDYSLWAKSDKFAATDAELKTFVNHFNNLNAVPGTGADLEGIHYIVPRTEENLIFGKKEKTGFFAAKSKSAVIIALYEGETAEGSEVRRAVENLAKYLVDTGY